MKTEIREWGFPIPFNHICDIIKLNSVKYLRYNMAGDSQYPYISVEATSEEFPKNIKSWLKIKTTKFSIFTRVPKILRDHSRESIDIVASNFFPEILRIYPLGFSFSNKRISVGRDYPHITHSGRIIVPYKYIKSHIKDEILNHTISFREVSHDMASQGILKCFITKDYIKDAFEYTLYNYSGGYITSRLKKLISFLNSFDKFVSNYKYDQTVNHPDYPFGYIIFKEELHD